MPKKWSTNRPSWSHPSWVAIFFWKWLSAQKEHMLTEMCQTWHILRITEISCREAWFFHHFHPHKVPPSFRVFFFSGHEWILSEKKKQNSASPLMINYNRMISCAIFFPVILRSDPPVITSHHSFRLLLRGHPELPLPGLPQCRSSTARASRSVASKLCSFLSNKNMTREFLKQSSPGPRATVAGNLGHLVSRQVIPR